MLFIFDYFQPIQTWFVFYLHVYNTHFTKKSLLLPKVFPSLKWHNSFISTLVFDRPKIKIYKWWTYISSKWQMKIKLMNTINTYNDKRQLWHQVFISFGLKSWGICLNLATWASIIYTFHLKIQIHIQIQFNLFLYILSLTLEQNIFFKNEKYSYEHKMTTPFATVKVAKYCIISFSKKADFLFS